MVTIDKCPFCGGEAYLREGRVYFHQRFTVECKECKSTTRWYIVDSPTMTYYGSDEITRYTSEQAQRLAIEAWNRRV